MKWILVFVVTMFFFACENQQNSDCAKIQKKYAQAVQAFSIAEQSYATAKAAIETACGLFVNEVDAKAVNVGQACETAKKVFIGAEIALVAAKSAMAIYKTQVDLVCAAK